MQGNMLEAKSSLSRLLLTQARSEGLQILTRDAIFRDDLPDTLVI